MESFWPMDQHRPSRTRTYAARKIVNFIQGSDTLSMKVMDDLCSGAQVLSRREHAVGTLFSETLGFWRSVPHADGASETVSRTSAPKRTRIQQTCNTQMAEPRERRRTRRWSSETIKATSRPTRRVWLGTLPKNGNVSGAMKTQSVSTRKLAVFVIFETNTSQKLMNGQEI